MLLTLILSVLGKGKLVGRPFPALSGLGTGQGEEDSNLKSGRAVKTGRITGVR